MFALGETVVIQTAATTPDPYSGDPIASWDVTPIERTVDNVLIASGGTTEPYQAARDSVDSDFDLIFPPSADLPAAQDRIVIRGLVCEVQGRPFLWKWPTNGADAGTVVKAKIREG